MASIRKRGHSYQITVFLGRDGAGKKITATTTYRPKKTTPAAAHKEVAAYARQFEERLRDGGLIRPEKMSLEAVVAEWQQSPAYTSLTKSSQDDYMATLINRIYPSLRTMMISSITPRHIQAIYDKMVQDGKAPKTVRRTHTVLASVMAYAHKSGLIQDNPCDRVYLPKLAADTGLHYWTADQAQSFLAFLASPHDIVHPAAVRKNGRLLPAWTEHIDPDPQWIALFTLAIYGGFRRGELIALTWEDIDTDKQTITIRSAVAKTSAGQIVKAPKTAAGVREIALPPACFRALAEWKKEQMARCLRAGSAWQGKTGKDYDANPIFCQDDGTRMNIDSVTHKMPKLIRHFNHCANVSDTLPTIRFHDLRHTSATLLLAAGADIETVSHRLGHSQASVTLDVYGHWMKETDRTAADTLGRLLGGS